MVFKSLVITLLLAASFLRAQPSLKPSIGSSLKPANADSIRAFPLLEVDPKNKNVGLQPGDTIPQFVLFDSNGNALDIQKELSKGKPVFLMDGSYTCPNFRVSLRALDKLVQSYGKEIGFFIIYTIEAHPGFPDACPYSNEYLPVKENYTEHIDYRQPVTYGQRKALAKIMQDNLRQPAPVFFDGPDNAWWLRFGPLPSVAYLITAKGRVYAKTISLHNSYERMVKDIERLLEHKH